MTGLILQRKAAAYLRLILVGADQITADMVIAMALLQMNLLSKSLMRTVPVNVILPADKMVFPGMPKREEKPYKTLYLLHGIFGNYTDWVCGTRIQRYAEENDLAVVMPSGDHAF